MNRLHSFEIESAATKKGKGHNAFCDESFPDGFFIISLVTIVIVTGVLVGLGAGGILDDGKENVGFAQFRITAPSFSGVSPNVTVLTMRVMAAYLVEDMNGEVDTGTSALLWLHPSCTTTFDACNATLVTALNLLGTVSALKTAMESTTRNYTIEANKKYNYVRLHTCKQADTNDAGAATFSYRSGNMNVTKSFRDARCNFTTVRVSPPIGVREQQGIIVSVTYNASAIGVQWDSEPSLASAHYNLTKSGPHATKYYTMDYPVWTASVESCPVVYSPKLALACATPP
jgi:hypothetical protein